MCRCTVQASVIFGDGRPLSNCAVAVLAPFSPVLGVSLLAGERCSLGVCCQLAHGV